MTDHKDIPPDQESAVSRRGLFQILGSVPAVAVAGAGLAQTQTPEHVHGDAPATNPAQPAFVRRVFNDRQWKTVRILSDLVIPADDRSASATQAGVPEAIDDWLDFRSAQDGNDNLKAEILGGLAWLDRESRRLGAADFVGLSADQQKQILDRIAFLDRAAKEDQHGVAFFNRFRGLVVGFYVSSKAGVAFLPYLGNRAVAHWEGCDPKVWAIIEERLKNGYQGLGGEAKPWAAS
jgi:gluconate 2-dehydrogenase subunit 3-like protein